MESGISTLGVKFGYAVETEKGKRPTEFKQLHRINDVGGLSLTTEQIDVSALEDLVSRYKPGRQDTGGTMPVTVNITDDTIAEWVNVISEYNDMETGFSMWFTLWSPYLSKSFDFTGAPPQQVPIPPMAQNGNMTAEMTLIVDEYAGPQEAIEPTETEGE